MTTQQFSSKVGQQPEGFYTYAYIREDGRPYYIGKGSGLRAWERHGSYRKPWKAPENERILILKWNLTEEEAHKHEIYMIAFYGNHYAKDGWLSLNFTDGGEGVSGYQYTDKLRQVRREQLKGNDYGSLVDWTDPGLKARHKEGCRKRVFVLTPARREANNSRRGPSYSWEHEDGQTFEGGCMELVETFGLCTSSAYKVINGQASKVGQWRCLNPEKEFALVALDESYHQSRVNKAAATRNAKNAKLLGLTLEEFESMSYAQRSRYKKDLLKGLAA